MFLSEFDVALLAYTRGDSEKIADIVRKVDMQEDQLPRLLYRNE